MVIKFWGVHGSLPRPGPKTLKYGGNTPCVEVRCGNTLIILDAGTGIRELGEDLLRRGAESQGTKTKIHAHILISHLHWDHIQGFAFFAPGFYEENEFDVYGVPDVSCNIRTCLERQMAEPTFPISVDQLGAVFRFHDVVPGNVLVLGDARVSVERLRHPGGCIGFRIECHGKTVIYASDTEHGHDVDGSLLELCRGAHVLIYDAMFAPDQYAGLWDGMPREAWGHSTWEAGVRLAVSAGVGQLILFHHGNDDRIMDEVERDARRRFPGATAAFEGLEIEL